MATAQAVHMRCFNPGFIWWLSIAVGDRVAIYHRTPVRLAPSRVFLSQCYFCSFSSKV